MTYLELKQEQTKRVSGILERNKVFFAFSHAQFEQNLKVPDGLIGETCIWKGLGNGGYLPKQFLDQYTLDMVELDFWFKKELLECKEEAINYELSNYECYYTHDLEPVYDLFFDVFTETEIMNIYKQNLCKNQ